MVFYVVPSMSHPFWKELIVSNHQFLSDKKVGKYAKQSK